MARPNLERTSSTSTSVSSCIVVNEYATLASSASSTTAPTSVTNVASFTSRTSAKDDGKDSQASSASTTTRSQRPRAGLPSYNENALSGTATRRRSAPLLRAQASSATLLPGAAPEDRELVRHSIAALDMDWRVGGLPGDIMTAERAGKLDRRKSVDLLLQRASDAMGKTKSALGKRGRGAMSMGAAELLKKGFGRKDSLRRRGHDGMVEPEMEKEEPAKKKTRLPLTEAAAAGEDKENFLPKGTEIKGKPTVEPRTKRWLTQGLYVGQEPDFDPRLTDAKNRAKRASMGGQVPKQRKILPMPMFAGKRLLEQGRNFRLPWDVFAPLPPGQPKPEEWRKTQKNVFIGDAADIWKHSKKLEHSLCVCTPESGCGDDCFNRFMFYECDDSNCAIGAERCTNRSFAGLRERCKAGGKYNIGVEVIKTADRGYGVRSNRTFDPHQIIVEYTGEIITQEECDHRMHTIYKDNECFYLMVFDQNMIIDATRGSIARFVNHACEPNCRMVKWTVAGKPRMALFAGERGIMTGEELTYDYNFDPFSSKNIQECRCGTANCRGVLGPRAPPPKEVKEALRPLAQPTSTKRKLQTAVVDAASALSAKKRRLSVAAQTQLTKARAAVGSESTQRRVVKKVSETSLKGGVDKKPAAKLQRRMTIVGVGAKEGKKASVAFAEDERPLSRRESVKSAAVGMKKNIVTTIRGGNAGGRVLGSKKSIRVIEA